ncbi:MAG: glutathione S-transferase family protein [Alphaproteobacteria bacterium]|nr:MAG: glutathione S-transferase family protein [Alphaproteobacteria bacterium]
MLKLLGRKTSGNVQKVLFFLEETGTDYRREDYGRQFGNTETDEYRALNPTMKVPTLIDGDLVIWESNTILRYLAATRAPELTGATPAERSLVERWMDFLLAAVNPGYIAAFKGARQKPEERAPGYAADVADLVRQMGIIDAHLQGRDWLALDRLTIADIACGPILKRCAGFDIGRPDMPGLEAWLSRLEARPAFARVTA